MGLCGYFNAISEKHLRYSLFVKRIIVIEAKLYFLGDSSLDMHDAVHTKMITDIATSVWLNEFCHKAIYSLEA